LSGAMCPRRSRGDMNDGIRLVLRIDIPSSFFVLLFSSSEAALLYFLCFSPLPIRTEEGCVGFASVRGYSADRGVLGVFIVVFGEQL
jgi:hypothetical protein